MDKALRKLLRDNPTMPVLLAHENTPKSWKVWCPHCRVYHFHGAMEGHRAAHCAYGGFSDTGYVIVAASDATRNMPKGQSTGIVP